MNVEKCHNPTQKRRKKKRKKKKEKKEKEKPDYNTENRY